MHVGRIGASEELSDGVVLQALAQLADVVIVGTCIVG